MKTNRTRSIINNKVTIGRQTVNEPITQTTLNIFFSFHRLFMVKSRVVLSYMSRILEYMPPQRGVGFLRRFGLKTSIDFGLESGIPDYGSVWNLLLFQFQMNNKEKNMRIRKGF